MGKIDAFLKSTTGQAIVRFAAVFVGFFVFELTKNGGAASVHAYVVAALAALPLALEKLLASSNSAVTPGPTGSPAAPPVDPPAAS